MDGNLGPAVSWIMREIEGIEKLLRKIAPNMRVIGDDVATIKGADAPVQRELAAPSTRRDWDSLPPIQRSTGDMPLVASPGSFAEGLPGSRGLPPIVQPLGHEVSNLATPGLVVARTRSAEAPAHGSLPAPVQRRAARNAASPAPIALHASAPEPEVVEHSAPAAAAPAPAPAAPIRTMPTVSRQAVRVPDRPLTSAASAARPAAVQRAEAAALAAGGAGAPSATSAPASSGRMRRVPSGMPVVSRQASASHAESTASMPPTPTSAASGPVMPAVSTPTRRGLGEPVAAAPASARPVADRVPVLSRSTTAGPMPIAASSLRPPVQRSTAPALSTGPLAAPTNGRTSTGEVPTVSRLADLPHLPVARPGSASAPGASARMSATASSAGAAASPASAAPSIRPIAAANPLRMSIGLQRQAADDLGDELGNGDREPGLPSPWWAPTPATAPPPAGAAANFDRAVAIEPSTPRSRTTAAASRGEAISAVQRAADSNRPAARAAAVQRSASAPARTSMPVRGAADHSHGSTPAVPASPGLAALPSGGSIGEPVVVQETRATGPSGPSGLNVAANGGPIAVQRAESAPSSGPAPDRGSLESASRSERDLDELAQALFGRLRGRIRSELIHDREARGLTFDNV